MKNFIQGQIEDLNQSLEWLLPYYNEVGSLPAIRMLLAYDMVIRPNFITWLMLTSYHSKTELGKRVIKDNLKCEIEENHPQLLLNDIVPIMAGTFSVVSIERLYREVDRVMQPIQAKQIRRLTSKAYSTRGFFMMALLENASLVFIPWMKEIYDHRVLHDSIARSRYLDIHGVADIKHAQEFIEAASAEFENEITEYSKNNLQMQAKVRGMIQRDLEEITQNIKIVFTGIFSFVNVSKTV